MTKDKLSALLFLAIATLCGCCGGGHSVTPAAGKITFEGKPLSGGGRVRFVPLSNQNQAMSARPASGEIQADGSFRLTTYDLNDGAIPGEHRVEVVQDPLIVPAAFEKGEMIRPAEPVAQEDLIPAIYGGPESPLRATVEVGGDGLQIDLQRLD